MAERAAVIAEAHTWVGTPFHHAARLKGVGVDCANLLIALYCGLGIVPDVAPEFYAPDWFLHSGVPQLRNWMEKTCTAVAAPVPGDILLYRYGRHEAHAAVLVGESMAVHSFRGRGVILSPCGPRSPLWARQSSAWTPNRWATS